MPTIGSSYNLGDTIEIDFYGAFDTLSYNYIPECMEVVVTSQILGLTRIDTGQNSLYHLHITDIAGRNIVQKKYSGSLYSFNTSSMLMVSGVYLIKYKDVLKGSRGQTVIIVDP
ncbi:MAG: T9SS type A sorting domain-containing protein [Aureispira sp.]